MRLFETIDIQENFKNPVLTIGNYDGIHLGHRRIIDRVKERARDISGTPMLMTFDPHPLHILGPDRELAAITPREEKVRLIAEAGIEVLFVLPFTADFARLSPEAFVASILVERLAIKGLVIGYDFRFGTGGKGEVGLLRELGAGQGFFVEVIGAVTVAGEKVGSNRIRKLVEEGDAAFARMLLARPYAIEGTVVRAKGRGAAIGYPTINLGTDYPLIPKTGVYVTRVEIEGQNFGAVTNIGCNPTFEEGGERSIETFILDFDGLLYGKRVRLHFLARIRDEEKFSSVDALRDRIAADVERARAYFREEGKEGP
jgi:riboflavin kinase/FMN adenylyltransferase